MGLLTVGGKEIVKKSTKKAANESAANLVKGDNLIGKVAGSKTSAANELNLEDFQPRQSYGKFAGKYEQESGKAAREAMEGGPLSVKSGGRLATKVEEGSSNALTRRTSLAETAAGVKGRTEKDMGMADVVEAAKLKGKEGMSSGSRAGGPSSGSGKAAAIAGGIAGAGGLAAIALMDRNEKSKTSESTPSSSSSQANKASESKSDSGSLADAVKDMPEKKAKKTISDFEKAFAKARDDGEKIFSFKGKDFTTRLKEESVSEFNKKFESKDDFAGRMEQSYENRQRYEAGEMNALAKGGFVKAKPKAHNGNRTSHSMNYNSIDMGKFMKKVKK